MCHGAMFLMHSAKDYIIVHAKVYVRMSSPHQSWAYKPRPSTAWVGFIIKLN